MRSGTTSLMAGKCVERGYNRLVDCAYLRDSERHYPTTLFGNCITFMLLSVCCMSEQSSTLLCSPTSPPEGLSNITEIQCEVVQPCLYFAHMQYR